MQAGSDPSESARQRTRPEPFDLRSLLDSAPHAMLVVDEDGRIADANARAEALLDEGHDGLAGARVADLLDPASREGFLRAFDASLRHGEAPGDMEISLTGAGLVEATFLPIRDGARRIALLLRDLTDEESRRDAETRAQAASFHAEAAAQRKMVDLGKLVAGVAHELRTPLTFVSNNLAIQRARLERPPADRAEWEAVLADALTANRIAQEGLDRVARILGELRPLSRNRPFSATPTDLAELVMDAVRTFRAADGGRARLELDLQATHRVPLDRDDLCNVVINLLNNAADAMGGKGVIRVQTRNADVPPEIRIIDHGPGVSEAFAPRLFEPFQTTKREGTGLGLFISRRSVEAHGGTLTHEPTPGGGATFVIRLPSPA